MTINFRIAVACRTPAYFAAGHLARALNADIYAIDNHCTDYTDGVKAKKWKGETIDTDHLLVVGVTALKYAARSIESNRYKTVAVIFSDTNCCVHYKWWNKFVKRNKIPVYAMPDLAQYCFVKWCPAYQTINTDGFKGEIKSNRLTICHSPHSKGIWKGTPAIRNIIKRLRSKYDFDYLEITKKTFNETIALKSTAHIFIDQLTYKNPHIPQKRFGGKIIYNGALGKSGLEGMRLRCCTITGAREVKTEPWFPTPPAVWVNYGNAELILKMLIENKEERERIAAMQQEWALKYTSPDFVTMNVTRHIK